MIGLIVGCAFAAVTVLGLAGCYVGNRIAKAMEVEREPIDNAVRSQRASTSEVDIKEHYAPSEPDAVLLNHGTWLQVRVDGKSYRYDDVDGVYDLETARPPTDKIINRALGVVRDYREAQKAEERKKQWALEDLAKRIIDRTEEAFKGTV